MIKLKHLLNENQGTFNKKVLQRIDTYIGNKYKKGGKEYQWILKTILRGALTSVNFHSEVKQLDKIFSRAEMPSDLDPKMEDIIEVSGTVFANLAKYDGVKIIEAFAFVVSLRVGRPLGEKLLKLIQSSSVGEQKMNEAQYADTYFESFTGAVEHVLRTVKKKGFEVDDEDWFSKVALGGRYGRGRPSRGKTHSFSVRLLKNGKETRTKVHFQVYGMKDTYELNMYIS